MTEPVDWVPADMMEELRKRLAEGQDHEARRTSLANRVDELPGPLGELLRTIATMHADFVDAYEMRGTTEAEAIRIERIIDAAVTFVDWLG